MHIPEDWYDKFSGRKYVIIPVADLDAIIAVECFREKRDEDSLSIYTEEKRIYVLDFKNPDERVYRYFMEHHIISEYNPDNFDAKYMYAKHAEVVELKKTLWFSSLFKKSSVRCLALSSCLKEAAIPISSSFELTIAEDKTSLASVKLQSNSYGANEYE